MTVSKPETAEVTQAERDLLEQLSWLTYIFDETGPNPLAVTLLKRRRLNSTPSRQGGAGNLVDMANVGEALMEAIRDYSSHSFMQSWSPADCPTEIVGDLLNALDEAGAALRPIETMDLWDTGVVTDGERAAVAQKAESDFGGHYFAIEPEDALEWEPTHWAPFPDRAALSDTPPPDNEETEALREALRKEVINSPETADFMAGVPLEAAHQRERWGASHDAGKTPFDWFWLVGYLAQKAASSAVAGDTDKAMHHTISTAAALANWHAALTGAHTLMRPGIGPDKAAGQ